MPMFQWEGKTRDGTARSGVLTAASDQAVIAQLKEQNIMATRVKTKAKNVEDYLTFLQRFGSLMLQYRGESAFTVQQSPELEELYIDKGMSERDAKTVVGIIAKNKDVWVDIMMVEELGIIESDESPLKNAIATFSSFSIFGFIPLLAHVLSQFIPILQQNTFLFATLLTGITLFALGALKVRITERNWFLSGLEMFIDGGTDAFPAY